MKKILVIEDNLEVRENLCEILELANYEVHAAANGKEGVKRAKEVIPHLILCDVMMPQLDGFGVLKILNTTVGINHIPLIFLTAKDEKSDVRIGMSLGADDYITKPFNDVELLEAIEIRLKKAEKLEQIALNESGGLQFFFSEAKAHKEFEALSSNQEVRHYKANSNIFEEGRNPRWLYHIVQGTVKVFQTNEYGKEFTTKIYKSGDFFGYFPLINDAVYSGTAVAIADSEIHLIPKDDFMLLLFNSRDFSSYFIKIIANRTESVESKLIDLAYSSVRKKVANVLLNEAATKQNTPPIIIDLSRDDMASLAGVSKETLIRTLSDFKSEGLIVSVKKAFVINSIQNLENIIS